LSKHFHIFIPTLFFGDEPASKQKLVPESWTCPRPGLTIQFWALVLLQSNIWTGVPLANTAPLTSKHLLLFPFGWILSPGRGRGTGVTVGTGGGLGVSVVIGPIVIVVERVELPVIVGGGVELPVTVGAGGDKVIVVVGVGLTVTGTVVVEVGLTVTGTEVPATVVSDTAGAEIVLVGYSMQPPSGGGPTPNPGGHCG